MVIKERYAADEVTDALYELETVIAYLDIEVKSAAESSEREYFARNLFVNDDQAYSYIDGINELKATIQDCRARFAALTHTELDD